MNNHTGDHFMVCVYEGGILACPLYTGICAMENLAQRCSFRMIWMTEYR